MILFTEPSTHHVHNCFVTGRGLFTWKCYVVTWFDYLPAILDKRYVAYDKLIDRIQSLIGQTMNKQQNEIWITKITNLSIAVCLVSLTACGGGGGGFGVGGSNCQVSDPTVAEKPLAYVKRPTPNDMGTPISGDVRDPEAFNPGAHLMVKSKAALCASEVDVTAAIIGDTGDVRDPEFSVDGSKLLFALHKEDDDVDPPETWDIYEYNLSNPLSQVSGSENPKRVMTSSLFANKGDDVAPHYMPGNRIIFSSTRAELTRAIAADTGTGGQFKPTIEATNSNNHAFNLHSMADDGSDIKQLTFNLSNDLDPTVIRNIPGLEGKVLFTRWEHSPGRSQMSLYTMNQDGSDVQHLYGAHSHNTGAGNSEIHFTQPRETSGGGVMVLARQFTDTFDGGDPMLINVTTYVDNTMPTASNPGMTGPAQTSTTNYAVSTVPGVSLAGRFSSVFPLQDGTNRALVSYSLCFVDVVIDVTTMTTETRACSDSSVDLTDPNTTEAAPRYGVFIYNIDTNTVMPITTPIPDTYFTDIAVAQDITAPSYIPDTPNPSAEPTGILDIRSVYDMDGSFNAMGSTATSISELANPATATGDKIQNPGLIERPARFLRIVKGAYLPDNDVRNFRGSAFGVNNGQLMREIIGYAPIDPDGSVRVKVPANVPLSISILDKNGRRIGNRHGNWLTVRPGETLSCNGCHDHTSGQPHGRSSAQPTSFYAGAPSDGSIFTNSTSSFTVHARDTMAEARTRLVSLELKPKVDIIFTDVWTDVTAAANMAVSRVLDGDIAYSYNLLSTTPPVNNTSCLGATGWDGNCRIVINYETHIHPLWSLVRTDAMGADVRCINCHTNTGVVPAGQLDLTDGASDMNADHFKAYRELVSNDNEVNAAGADVLVPGFDADGNPIMVPITVTRSVVPGSANGSRFFDKFTAGAGATPHCTDNGMGTCVPWLSVHELKMLSEWVDIGAQYYNDPFAAPIN